MWREATDEQEWLRFRVFRRRGQHSGRRCGGVDETSGEVAAEGNDGNGNPAVPD